MVQPPYEVREEKPPRGREPLYGAPYIWRCTSVHLAEYIWHLAVYIWQSGEVNPSDPPRHGEPTGRWAVVINNVSSSVVGLFANGAPKVHQDQDT